MDAIDNAIEIAARVERVIDAARLAAEHAPGAPIGRSRTVDLRRLAAELAELDAYAESITSPESGSTAARPS